MKCVDSSLSQNLISTSILGFLFVISSSENVCILSNFLCLQLFGSVKNTCQIFYVFGFEMANCCQTSIVDFETLFCEVEAWNLGAIFVV